MSILAPSLPPSDPLPSSPSSPFSILPLDLTSKILSLLPLSSKLACKCVCKSWLSISSSDPLLSYTSNRFPRPPSSSPNPCFLLATKGRFAYSLHPPSGIWSRLPKPPYPSVSILAASEGLVCLGNQVSECRTLAVLNLLSNRCKPLPSTRKVGLLHKVTMAVDRETKAYVVVATGEDSMGWFSSPRRRVLAAQNYQLLTEVYDSAANEWRSAGAPPPDAKFGSDPGVWWRGRFFCLTELPYGIAAFDLARGLWTEVAPDMPPGMVSPSLFCCAGRLLMVGITRPDSGPSHGGTKQCGAGLGAVLFHGNGGGKSGARSHGQGGDSDHCRHAHLDGNGRSGDDESGCFLDRGRKPDHGSAYYFSQNGQESTGDHGSSRFCQNGKRKDHASNFCQNMRKSEDGLKNRYRDLNFSAPIIASPSSCSSASPRASSSILIHSPPLRSWSWSGPLQSLASSSWAWLSTWSSSLTTSPSLTTLWSLSSAAAASGAAPPPMTSTTSTLADCPTSTMLRPASPPIPTTPLTLAPADLRAPTMPIPDDPSITRRISIWRLSMDLKRWELVEEMPREICEEFMSHLGGRTPLICTGVGEDVCITTYYSPKAAIMNMGSRAWKLAEPDPAFPRDRDAHLMGFTMEPDMNCAP